MIGNYQSPLTKKLLRQALGLSAVVPLLFTTYGGMAWAADDNGNVPLQNSSLPLPYLHMDNAASEALVNGSKEHDTSFDTANRPILNEFLGKTENAAIGSNAIASMFHADFLDGQGPIIIDNDEVQEAVQTIKYEEMPLADGGKKVKAGARFPVVVATEMNSKDAKEGDAFQARLKYDLKIGDRLVAKKGAVVTGHINYVLPARSAMHAMMSTTRWYKNSGVLGIAFDDVLNEKGEHLPLEAQPARMSRIVKNKGEGRELGVNYKGQVVGPWSQQLKYKAIRIGMNAAMAPAGVFTFGAMPVALGLIGAANPSFAFMKPVGLNVRHRRLKGFAWGFLSGVPGSFLIEDSVVRGQEAIIQPGDEFLVEMNTEFTGEPATDAQLAPSATTRVHGQILNAKKKHRQATTTQG
jgi:hypothetical protein